jgi:hypothetical protein
MASYSNALKTSHECLFFYGKSRPNDNSKKKLDKLEENMESNHWVHKHLYLLHSPFDLSKVQNHD